jgi:hypothetical protein
MVPKCVQLLLMMGVDTGEQRSAGTANCSVIVVTNITDHLFWYE